MHTRSWLWIVTALLGVMAPPGLAAAGTDRDAARPVTVAAPMGLLDLCERQPQTCAEAGQDDADVLHAVRQARRMAWSERLATRPAAGLKPSGRRSTGVAAPDQPSLKPAFLGQQASFDTLSAAPDLRTMSALNAEINRAVRPMSDQRLHGRPDVWTLPVALGGGRLAGDCEDIVLAKRDALIQSGVDPARLSIALAVTPSGEDHAVLLVARPDGDFVLDNLDSRVLHWSQVDLRWKARQVPGDMLSWIRL